MKQKSTSKDLYVADISFDAVEEDLQKLFAHCGTVRAIHMITDLKSGQFKGCAFVHMNNAAEARDAINTLDGTYLINRCIKVSQALPRKSAPRSKKPNLEKLRSAATKRGNRK
jgi:RNA recognition motif-containing protein